MIDRPAVTRETCSLRTASRLLFFFHRRSRHSLAAGSNEEFQRSKSTLPTRGALLPVLIVSLSYCSAVSVLLNPRLVDLEHLVANKAARRISLVKLLCATSCPVFPFCSIGNPRFGGTPRARRAIGIGDRSMLVSLAFKSRTSVVLDCLTTNQCDPDSSNRSSLRSTDRHSRELSSFFTRHRLDVVSFVARCYSSSIHTQEINVIASVCKRSISPFLGRQKFSMSRRTSVCACVYSDATEKNVPVKRFLMYERNYSVDHQSRDITVCIVSRAQHWHACGNWNRG